MTSAPSIDHRVKVAVLMLLAAGTLLFSLFLNEPGHLSIDESVYHLMARSFSNSGSLALLNGYEEFASRELVFPISQPRAGHLYSQYPYLFPVLTAPFYLALGYKGLFLLNAFAFLGAVWLCYAIGQKLFKDRDLSLNACFILILATYAWEYSQAAWPHAVSMLFVAGAVYLSISAYYMANPARCLALAFGAGLVAGLGTGVRFDAVFAMPALVLPFMFRSPPRLWPIVATGLGTLPGLTLLGATNYAKFGIASPLSYGAQATGEPTTVAAYVPLFAVGVCLVLVLWALTRPRNRAFLTAYRWQSSAILAVMAGAALLIPDVWMMVSRFADGAYQLVVDLRIRDPGIIESGLSRSPDGAMIYMGAIKKSLLQSCPYLVVLLLPLIYMARGERDAPELSLLFLVPAGYIAAFSYFAWHGGLSLNLRYFVPVLLFTSILASYSWREVVQLSGASKWGPKAGTMAAALLVVVVVGVTPLSLLAFEVLETVLLTGPLVLSVALLVFLVAHWVSPRRWRIALANSAVAGLVVAFAWAGTVAFTYDLHRAWAKRALSHEFSAEVAAFVSPDSIVFVDFATPLSGLYELNRVRLAQATWDEFQGFRALLDFHLMAGRPVYGLFEPLTWDELDEDGLLSGLRAVPIYEIGSERLAQIVKVKSAAAEIRDQAE